MIIWNVYLKGEEFFLKEVSKRYRSSSIKVSEAGGRFKLDSKYFSILKSDEEVYKKAVSLLKKINGAMKIATDYYKPIEIQSISNIDDKGCVRVTARFKLTVYPAQVAFSDDSIMPEANWPEVAENNRSVSKLLDLFGKKLDWVNLNKLLEIIQEDQGSKIYEKKWTTERTICRFQQTANSFSAVGDAARHGHEKTSPPKKPMNIEEAKILIRSIAKMWLNEKVCLK